MEPVADASASAQVPPREAVAAVRAAEEPTDMPTEMEEALTEVPTEPREVLLPLHLLHFFVLQLGGYLPEGMQGRP